MKHIVYNESSEDMVGLENESIHLIVTSPPYNTGMEYKGFDDAVSYDTYITMITRVLQECYRVLVRGGKICVNVANTGRKPYRPLVSLYEELLLKLGFLIRGEIIWQKWSNATTTAWGSYLSPSNPTLRDVHEYVIVASKSMDSLKPPENAISDITKEEWLQYTSSIWKFGPKSSLKHPAVFPEEIARRFIKLYTWENCTVMDPFAGTGTVSKVAKELNRNSVAFEISEEYVLLIEDIIYQRSLEEFWSEYFMNEVTQ